MKEKTIEWVAQMWAEHGECLEVGEDRDGLDMTEIRWRGENGGVVSSVAFVNAMIPLVIKALQRRMGDVTSTP